MVLYPADNAVLLCQGNELIVVREQLCRGFRDQYMQLALDRILGNRVVGAYVDV